jgi:hypothetical protein
VSVVGRRTEMKFEAGKEYFIRFHSYMVATEMFTKADLVDKETALPEISTMRLALNKSDDM